MQSRSSLPLALTRAFAAARRQFADLVTTSLVPPARPGRDKRSSTAEKLRDTARASMAEVQ